MTDCHDAGSTGTSSNDREADLLPLGESVRHHNESTRPQDQFPAGATRSSRVLRAELRQDLTSVAAAAISALAELDYQDRDEAADTGPALLSMSRVTLPLTAAASSMRSALAVHLTLQSRELSTHSQED